MKNLKNYLLFGIIAGSLFFTSCEKDDDEKTQRNPLEETIAEYAAAEENFSILVEALTKADLVSALNGSGDFTVFAPTNAAFEALFASLGVSGVADLSKATLEPILLYHVLGQEYSSGMISSGYYSSLSPAQGDYLSIYIVKSGGIQINNEANVTAADVEVANGVIHVIDKVLLPPTIVDIASANDNFESLVSAVVKAELATTLSGTGTFTVFAPTDDAFTALFTALGVTLNDLTKDDLTPILLYHVLGSAVYSDDLSSSIVNTLNAEDPELVVEISSSVMLNGMAEVVATDIVGTNGVIHVIDEVILPIDNSSILDLAMASAPEFTSLIAALAKSNLASTFIKDGDYTVFAPTNAAFTALLTELGVTLNDLTAADLTPILLYHVAGAEVKSTDLATGYYKSLYTAVEDEAVTFYVDLTSGVEINGSITVTSADIDASNGVIHVIEAVMTAPDVVDIAINNSGFSELVKAVVKADLVATLKGTGPFTIFAPTDAAFNQLYADLNLTNGLDDLTAAELVPILQYHVVSGNVTASELTAGNVATLNGDIAITLSPPTINGDSEIIVTDVQGINGVVHAIDKVLLPPSK